MDKIDWVAVILALAIVSTMLPSLVGGIKDIVLKWRARKHPEAG